ncbi:MAG: histidine phosphatase family protein [Gammaproteobacteria bacterium]|nr:histidine phosphatase family protein [Pseudomonadales bacterium]MCP5345411.1 histidine phosphatase family protein [Pseudomonadales bacterium]
MSELVFVRHGQASFGAASYDKLSDAGLSQVRQLSRHWQELGETFDHLYSGDLLRQRETATELLPHVEQSGREIKINPAFNEYNGDPLIAIFLRDHAGAAGFEQGLKLPISEQRLFQKVFEAATARWITDRLIPTAADQGYESWRDFQRRVHGAMDALMETHQNGSRVLISTSGGVIALALQRALGFPDEQAIATNWMVHNSSVSRIRYGNGRISLTQFNSLAHLEKPDLRQLVTYR